VNGPQKKKEFSTEMRILLASVLSMLVIILWAKFFAPKLPVNPQPQGAQAPVANAPATNPSVTTPGAAAAAPTARAPAAPATPAKGDTQERTIIVENDLCRVEFSNRGAVVKSWQLKKYMDDAKPPRILDLVHADSAQQTGGCPFSLVLNDPRDETAVNSALFQAVPSEALVKAPQELRFEWSDGHLHVTKRFRFDQSYVANVGAEVSYDGQPVAFGIAWRAAFGDITVTNPVYYDQVQIFYSVGGKLQILPHKKLNPPEQTAPGTWMTGDDYVGIEDRYFAAAFLPETGAPPASLAVRYWKRERTIQVDGKPVQEPVAEVAVNSVTAGSFAARLYVGPKDYDDLKKMNPPLHDLVQFGWFEFIASPVFHLLKWLHGYIPNWGWAIIVLTSAINMLLFPMRISSYRTALKMQKIQPEMKVLQDRMKKYKMNDPRKMEAQKELQALFKREGINPAGGCLPMLLQFPIWIGLNSALRGAIELRHAPWIFWIKDLSANDPYRILPIAMGLFMYLASKMTPMTTTDPQQQAMMKIMPIAMAGIFVISPFSSGLALYILTSSVVGVAQQWWLNKTHPLPAPAPGKSARGKK